MARGWATLFSRTKARGGLRNTMARPGEVASTSYVPRESTLSVRPGFTLVELLIVIALTIMIFTVTLQGMTNSQKLFIFSNNYEKVVNLVRQARSLALTGKAMPDYTDFDHDGCKDKEWNTANGAIGCDAGGDLVTPAHYGMFFDNTTGAKKVVLFADIHTENGNAEGVYVKPPDGTALGVHTTVVGSDVNLAEIDLPVGLGLIVSGGPKVIFYSPIFADVTFDTPLGSSAKFFIFGAQELSSDKKNARKKCSQIHPLAGIPEIAPEVNCN